MRGHNTRSSCHCEVWSGIPRHFSCSGLSARLAARQGCFWGADPLPPENSMRYRVPSNTLPWDRVIPATCQQICKELNYKYFSLHVSRTTLCVCVCLCVCACVCVSQLPIIQGGPTAPRFLSSSTRGLSPPISFPSNIELRRRVNFSPRPRPDLLHPTPGPSYLEAHVPPATPRLRPRTGSAIRRARDGAAPARATASS